MHGYGTADSQDTDAEGARQGSYEDNIKVRITWATQREEMLKNTLLGPM